VRLGVLRIRRDARARRSERVGQSSQVEHRILDAQTRVEVVRTQADTPAGVAPAPAATEPAARPSPAASTDAHGLLSAERSAEFKRRWRDLQADFVDDPQQAVREAGDLSREILRALSDTIADADRVDRWQAEDGTSGTEDLRVALRHYRTLVDGLLQL